MQPFNPQPLLVVLQTRIFFLVGDPEKKWVYTIEPLLPPSKSLLRVQIKRLHVVFEFPWVTRPYLHDLTIYILLFFCRFWEPSWTERKFVSLVFLAQPPNTLKFCLYSGKYINISCWLLNLEYILDTSFYFDT